MDTKLTQQNSNSLSQDSQNYVLSSQLSQQSNNPPSTPPQQLNSSTPSTPSTPLLYGETVDEEYQEFTDGDLPVVTYSFTEDITNGRWVINLLWPTEKKPLSWRGKFGFCICVYRKVDEVTYTQILTTKSSPFSIFSKPDVFLKKLRKEQPKKKKTPTQPNLSQYNQKTSTPVVSETRQSVVKPTANTTTNIVKQETDPYHAFLNFVQEANKTHTMLDGNPSSPNKKRKF